MRTDMRIFKQTTRLLFLGVAVAALAACAGGYKAQSALDTPEAHYQAGMQLLTQQRLDEARAEFEVAVQLDKDYAPGYEGLGLCALEIGDGREAESQFKKSISRDRTYAPAHAGLGRAYTLQGQPKNAIKAFEDAIGANARYAPAYDYLGQTYVDQRDFAGAVESYRRGITALPNDTALNDGWQRVSELQRATMGMPPKYVEIALSEAVDRAELAVLLNEELPLQEIFAPKTTPADQQYVAPGQQARDTERTAAANDIPADYWAKVQVEQAVELGAMDLFPDGSFKPDQVVTRQDMAMLIQRILVAAWNDPSLKSKFFGSTSPFPDVPGTHFAFNAVSLATTRGIMSGRPNGTFFLEGTIPGHEAILIVRNLKGALKP